MSCTKAKRSRAKNTKKDGNERGQQSCPSLSNPVRSGILSLLLLSGVAGSASFDIDQSSPQLGAYS